MLCIILNALLLILFKNMNIYISIFYIILLYYVAKIHCIFRIIIN